MKIRKKTKGTLISQVITAVLCAFLTVGVMLWFHACGPKEDGTWMSCHYAQLTVFGLALVMTILSIAAIFAPLKAQKCLDVLTAILGAAAALIPGNVISLCMMDEMQCRRVMRPSVILISVLIIAFACVSIITGKERRNR